MGKEDQAEEIEILQSIYPEELEVHDETSFSIHLRLETEAPRQLLIDFDYPETYPEETTPGISITVELTEEEEYEEGRQAEEEQEDTNEPKFTYAFTKADCVQLVAQAKEIAEENLGIPSVFTLVSQIKELAEELYDTRIRDQEAERLRLLSIEEEKEQAKFRGTPVTKASFTEWRTKFRAEMGWDKPKERPFGRFTGREIFEKGMYTEEDDDEVDDVDGKAEESETESRDDR